jgi:hypothetical protein
MLQVVECMQSRGWWLDVVSDEVGDAGATGFGNDNAPAGEPALSCQLAMVAAAGVAAGPLAGLAARLHLVSLLVTMGAACVSPDVALHRQAAAEACGMAQSDRWPFQGTTPGLAEPHQAEDEHPEVQDVAAALRAALMLQDSVARVAKACAEVAG